MANAVDVSSLWTDKVAVGNIVTQYYQDQSGNNQKKKELENVLNDLKRYPYAYKYCHELLNESAESSFFALLVYEEFVNRHWFQVEEQERDQIRKSLFNYLTSNTHALYVENTLIKVLVDISRQDSKWQQPLFQDAYSLANDPFSLTLGLSLLKTACDEFMSNRENVLASRKLELKQVLEAQAPSIVSMLTQILSSTFERLLVSPSETKAPDCSPVLLSKNLPFHSASPYPSPISPATKSANADFFVHCGKLDKRNLQICNSCFEILSSLMTWVPLTTVNTPRVIDTILKFAQLTDEQSIELGAAALTCANEIVGRNLPENVESLFLLIKNISDLLKVFVDSPQTMECLSEDYRQKFTDFIQLFVSQHIIRAESLVDFPLMDFLQLLFSYTFIQTELEGFMSCIQIWSSFVGYLSLCKSSNATTIATKLANYEGGILSLTTGVMKKIQFLENSAELAELDDEQEVLASDSDVKPMTELETFLLKNIELVAEVADLYPGQTIGQLFENLSNLTDMVVTKRQELAPKMAINATKDLRTHLQIFGQINHIFQNNFQENFSSSLQLVCKFINVLDLCIGESLYRSGKEYQKLTTDAFATIQLYIHWIANYHTLALQTPEHMENYTELQNKILILILQAINSQNPQITTSATSLLNSMTSTIRSDTILAFEPMQSLVNQLPAVLIALNTEPKRLLMKSVTNAFALVNANQKIDEAGWAERKRAFAELIASLEQEFIAIIQSPSFSGPLDYSTKNHIQHHLNILCAAIDAIKNENTTSKQVVFEAISDKIVPILKLTELTGSDDEVVGGVLDFTLALFAGLRKQITSQNLAVITESMTMFMNNFSGDKLARVHETAQSAENLEKYLQLSLCLVEDTSKAFSQFIPNLINYVLAELHPRCFVRESKSLEPAQKTFYELVQKILISHWKYFFPTSAVQRLVGQPVLVESQNQGQFDALLNVIFQSFEKTNVDVFKQNLESLDSVNQKCNLFRRDAFKANFFYKFFSAFLRMLVEKSRDFLRDEIITMVWKIIESDLASFKSQDAPRFVYEYCQNMDDNRKNMVSSYLMRINDASTCTEQLNMLINDFGYLMSYI